MYPFQVLRRHKAVLVGVGRAGFGTSSVMTPWAVGLHRPGRQVPSGFTGRASRLNTGTCVLCRVRRNRLSAART